MRIFNQIIPFLPNFDELFIEINSFIELVFGYLKYVFFCILLIIGILTLLSLRGKYFLERIRYSKEQKLADNPMTKPRLILGSLYIFFAFGILLDFFTFFLLVVLDPLPDRFIFNFVSFSGLIDPFALNGVSDISKAVYPYEKTIYYGVAIVSFMALLTITISLWQIINKEGKATKKSIVSLISGTVTGLLAGFTTCLPLFL
ncbi:MAG: hypothetical protein E3J90_08870 [Promethearchaeota archaeon]|nr:MAG: hypothetical protein E3J90_08870 [Candidatus Lokiarchaeota archaeon]